MGCEVGTIIGRFQSEAQAECFVACFNDIMEKKESWFEEDHRISMDDFDDDLTCELDIWGRFKNTMDTALKDVVGALVQRWPSEGFTVCYEQGWDNSGETYAEEYSYVGNQLTVTFWEDDVYWADDEDEDDEDEDTYADEYADEDDEDNIKVSHKVVWKNTWVFTCADGALTLVSGKPDTAVMEAMGITV